MAEREQQPGAQPDERRQGAGPRRLAPSHGQQDTLHKRVEFQVPNCVFFSCFVFVFIFIERVSNRSMADDLKSLDLSFNELDELPVRALKSLRVLDWANFHG